MPARDTYHDTVKNALIKDDWEITHDPLSLKWGTRDMYVDLGASQLLAADKGERQIAAGMKSFVGQSDMNDLDKAMGQYLVYQDVLAEVEPNRTLYLAIANETFEGIFSEPLGQLLIKNNRANLLIFNPLRETISQWIP